MDDSFFASEIVANAIEEIMDMQTQVMLFAQFGEYASLEDQKENLELLRNLKEKQMNMCFRCMLSDSEDAKKLLGEVMDHFKKFGHDVDTSDPLKVFAEVEQSLVEMQDDIEYCEKHGFFPGEEPGGETPPYEL